MGRREGMDGPSAAATAAAACCAAACCAAACGRSTESDPLGAEERIRRALLGMQAGDALAAPLHWYYNIAVMKQHLREAWGCEQLRCYAAVPEGLQHPDSWNYMKSFDAAACKIDLMHGKPPWAPGVF